MSDVIDRFVVVLDANVLYPFRMRDALLRFAEAGLFRARWSQTILAEWAAALLAKKPHMKTSIDRQLEAMRKTFPEACAEGFEDLIAGIKLPDPDDRHVVAAAILVDADHIVTQNLRDFPPKAIAKYGIEAVTADDFLSSTFELYQLEATGALRAMRNAYSNPPFQPGEFVLDLQARGLPKLASQIKYHIDII